MFKADERIDANQLPINHVRLTDTSRKRMARFLQI
jgi:hypothetical protein